MPAQERENGKLLKVDALLPYVDMLLRVVFSDPEVASCHVDSRGRALDMSPRSRSVLGSLGATGIRGRHVLCSRRRSGIPVCLRIFESSASRGQDAAALSEVQKRCSIVAPRIKRTLIRLRIGISATRSADRLSIGRGKTLCVYILDPILCDLKYSNILFASSTAQHFCTSNCTVYPFKIQLPC